MRSLRPLPLLAATAALALGSAPAMAQSLPDTARCLLVSNIFAASSDPKAKQAGVQSRYFYLGRLTGTPAQIEAALAAQGKTITEKNAGPTMQACARTVVDKANQLQAIGQRLRSGEAK